LDAILGTKGLRVMKSDCIDIAGDAIKVPMKNQPKSESLERILTEGEELLTNALNSTIAMK